MKLLTIFTLLYSSIVLSDCDTFYKSSVHDVYDKNYTKNTYEEEFNEHCESNGRSKNTGVNVAYKEISGVFSEDKMSVNAFCKTYHNIVTNNQELKINKRTVVKNAHALYNQCKAIENGNVNINITTARPADWARFNISIVSRNRFRLNAVITPPNNSGEDAVNCIIKVGAKEKELDNRAIKIPARSQLTLICDRIPDESNPKIKFIEGSVVLNLTGLIENVLEIPLNAVPERPFLDELLQQVAILEDKLIAIEPHIFIGDSFNPKCYYYAVTENGSRFNFTSSTSDQLHMDHSSGGFIQYKVEYESKIKSRGSSNISETIQDEEAKIYEVCED